MLDPTNSFLTGDSGNTRDQISTVYEAQIPRGYLGWGNVSSLGFGLAGAWGEAGLSRASVVNVTGDAGVAYMMGNFEAVVRYGLGITTVHINNGGFAGYGPGFWGAGTTLHLQVSDHAAANVGDGQAQGYYAEDVTDRRRSSRPYGGPSRRMARTSQPIWSSSARSTRSMAAGSHDSATSGLSSTPPPTHGTHYRPGGYLMGVVARVLEHAYVIL